MNLKGIIGSLVEFSTQYRVAAISIPVALCLLLSSGLTRIEVDVSNESMFSDGDIAIDSYRAFKKQFGRDDLVVIAIESDEIFNRRFMDTLGELHRELEQSVPWLEDVTSLYNVNWIENEADTLNIGWLGEKWPTEGNVDSAIRDEIINSPLYKNVLINSDGTMTLLVLRAVAFSSPETIQIALNKLGKVSISTESLSVKEKIIRWHDKFNAYLEGVEYQEPIKEQVDSGQDDFFADELESEASSNGSTQDGPEDKLLTGTQLKEFLAAINSVVHKYNDPTFSIRLTGGPIIDEAHSATIHSDVIVLVALTFIIIAVALALFFNTLLAVIVPISVIIMSLLSTLGLMAYLNMPVSVVSQALPPILITAGVLDSVHLFGMYYLRKSRGTDIKTAISYSMEHAGVALFYTSVTTAVGFISFSFARLKPISDFGWMAAFGVLIALFYTYLLVPSLISIFEERKEQKLAKSSVGTTQPIKAKWSIYQRVLEKIVDFSLGNEKLVLVVVAVSILIGLPGIFKLQYSHDILGWFEEDAVIRKDTNYIDNKMQATVPLEMLVETGKDNGILNPDFMQKLYDFQQNALQIRNEYAAVGSATSIVDRLVRIHSELIDDGTLLPESANLLEQEFILFEGGGAQEIRRLVNRDYSLARVTIRLSWTDAKHYVELRQRILEEADKELGGLASVQLTGTVDLLTNGVVDVISSMFKSYGIAVVFIGLMLVLLLSRVKLGLLCLIPNILPIYVALAVMGYLAIPIDMFTVLLGGITLGIAVDDTMHITNSALMEIEKRGRSLSEAIKHGVGRVGPVLTVTTSIMSVGFLTFVFSNINPLSNFGLIMCLVMLGSLLCDLFVLPALIQHVEKKEQTDGVAKDAMLDSAL